MELADIEGLSELGGSSGPQVGNGQLADLVSDCLTRLGDVAVDLVLEKERGKIICGLRIHILRVTLITILDCFLTRDAIKEISD